MRYLLSIALVMCLGCATSPDQSDLRYNYYEDEFSYAEPDETLRYNYYEDRFEFSK